MKLQGTTAAFFTGADTDHRLGHKSIMTLARATLLQGHHQKIIAGRHPFWNELAIAPVGMN